MEQITKFIDHYRSYTESHPGLCISSKFAPWYSLLKVKKLPGLGRIPFMYIKKEFLPCKSVLPDSFIFFYNIVFMLLNLWSFSHRNLHKANTLPRVLQSGQHRFLMLLNDYHNFVRIRCHLLLCFLYSLLNGVLFLKWELVLIVHTFCRKLKLKYYKKSLDYLIYWNEIRNIVRILFL